jgi:hypothetical protein
MGVYTMFGSQKKVKGKKVKGKNEEGKKESGKWEDYFNCLVQVKVEGKIVIKFLFHCLV